MNTRVLRIGVLALVGAGILTACGSSDRPREVSLSDTNTCDLVSRSDYPRLQVLATPRASPDLDAGEEGAGCAYLPRTGDLVNVDQITNEGIGRWTDGDVEHGKFIDLPRVGGFRTIRVWRTYEENGPHTKCTLYVDVADDQSLKVEVGENSAKEPPTCDTARSFAEAAMRTLTT